MEAAWGGVLEPARPTFSENSGKSSSPSQNTGNSASSDGIFHGGFTGAPVVFTPGATRSSCRVAIGIAGATQLECASVEAAWA